MQMMESDEEDEGDAEFAVEISKQELVKCHASHSPSSAICDFSFSGQCYPGYGS